MEKATNYKNGKKAERIRKENKNFSGDGGGGGESRVNNSPKAFGELKKFKIEMLFNFSDQIWAVVIYA